MKQIILTYNELVLDDSAANAYKTVLESLGIKVILKDIPNNRIPIVHDLLIYLSQRARNMLGEVIEHNWSMSIETFLYNYSICEVRRKVQIGDVTINEINNALQKLGYNWCAYCRKCPLAELFK
jgi:hypothetical protein